LRAHELDRASERISTQRTGEQAIDVRGRLANAPVGLDLFRIDLTGQQVLAECDIDRRQHDVRFGELLRSGTTILVDRGQRGA
jgi:hypothetical protein